jgi:hypothetical protein
LTPDFRPSEEASRLPMTDELDAYDAFLEGLACEAGPTADHRLWRVTKPGREIA